MFLRITGDTDIQSGVGSIIDDSSGPTEDYFSPLDYGTGAPDIAVILMCQDSGLNLKRRVRLSKKDKTLYLDVMLDLQTMKSVQPEARRQFVFKKIHDDVTEVIARYGLPNFDSGRFLKDLKSWLDSRLNGVGK
ncbi:MAG: hypothetical protein WCO42_10300 [bacterium]